MTRHDDEDDAIDDADADLAEAEAEDHRAVGPDDADADLFDGDSEHTVECPSCGAIIWREAEHCPRCNNWLTEADREGRLPVRASGWQGKIWTWVIVLMIVLIVVLMKTH